MSGSPFALRNWRVRTRLIALIAIPTLVGVIFGGLRVTDSISSAQQYQLISDVGRLVSQLGELSRDLGLERDLAGRFVAANKRATEGQRLKSQQEIVDASVNRTKAVAGEARDSLSEIGRRTLDRIEVRLAQLGSLRTTYTKDQLPPLPTVETYSEIIADLLQVYDELGQGSTDEQLTSTAAALRTIARAEEEASKQRALLMIALVRGRFEEPEFKGFLDAGSRRESERASFNAVATPAQRQNFDNTVASQKIGRAEFYISRAVLLHNTATPLRRLDNSTSKDVDLWFDSISETVDRLHQVQKSLAEEVATRSADVASGDRQLAAINIGIVVVLLVLVLAITALMAGSLVRPLRRLRSDALKIAGHTLPDLVRQLRNTDIDPDKLRVPPIEINSKDEIGEVARAFDEVHREAVRLAGEESKLRSNVNAMFVNLSRRSQTLVERQITLIDGLEQGEQDEQRLGNLFKLDHLATRMRRNSENLLVLAGQEPPRRWSQPVQLVDVARASLSEVENYERVVLEVPEGVAIAGQAVNDVIHLLAELIENALSFSPRETRVPVSGSRIDGGGIMLSISDSGIGMTAEELAQANERLTDAPTVDVSVSRRMGLFVVARLAHRHGIRVQLRPHGSGGLTAMVLIPESLLGPQAPSYAGAAPAASREESFPVAQHAPQGGSWPASSFQLGPGHPSYPSYPSTDAVPPAGSWPSSPALPAEAAGWMSSDSSNDVWVTSRGPAAGESRLPQRENGLRENGLRENGLRENGLPQREGGLPQRGGLSDDTRPWMRGVEAAPPAPNSFDFPETESAATGPMPAIPSGPSGPPSGGAAGNGGNGEYLPIFASVESAWFDQAAAAADATWSSPKADAGWSAAEAVREPVRDGATAAGLPKRVPKANLVPGSADTVSAPKGVAPMPAVSPDRVRSRLSSFQQGFRAARDDISEGRTYGSGPRDNSRDEGA
ncbi:nitrate- and nitrite sensing domain-containing protein [Nonomuraea sp. NPDC049419]|uniref:sensor histidine kinase n=1 Tax=Nonomuraea sp. NPDC049419 TaxID=3155772 RepID=UPI0034499E20